MTSLTQLHLPSGQSAALRLATREDVPAIVQLLADDQLGRERGATNDDGASELEPYLRAFDAIDAYPAHLLVVVVLEDAVVGTMQLTFLPGLARRGALRAQIEAVRVASALRSQGLGAAMITWAAEEARRRACAFVQLTTDKRRTSAHRFYERLGFTASHEGMKLQL